MANVPKFKIVEPTAEDEEILARLNKLKQRSWLTDLFLLLIFRLSIVQFINLLCHLFLSLHQRHQQVISLSCQLPSTYTLQFLPTLQSVGDPLPFPALFPKTSDESLLPASLCGTWIHCERVPLWLHSHRLLHWGLVLPSGGGCRVKSWFGRWCSGCFEWTRWHRASCDWVARRV